MRAARGRICAALSLCCAKSLPLTGQGDVRRRVPSRRAWAPQRCSIASVAAASHTLHARDACERSGEETVTASEAASLPAPLSCRLRCTTPSNSIGLPQMRLSSVLLSRIFTALWPGSQKLRELRASRVSQSAVGRCVERRRAELKLRDAPQACHRISPVSAGPSLSRLWFQQTREHVRKERFGRKLAALLRAARGVRAGLR